MAKKARLSGIPMGCDFLSIQCSDRSSTGIWSCQARCGGVQKPKFGAVINEKRGTIRFYD